MDDIQLFQIVNEIRKGHLETCQHGQVMDIISCFDIDDRQAVELLKSIGLGIKEKSS